MYRTKLGELTNEGKDESGYAETDPTGRYGRVSFLIIYICNFLFFFKSYVWLIMSMQVCRLL